MRVRLVAALAVVVAAGCGSSTAGTPEAVPTADVSSTAAPVPQLPPRPRSFDIAKTNPCTLIPLKRRAELGIDRPARPPHSIDSAPGGLFCSLASSTGASFAVVTDPSQNAQDILNSKNTNIRTVESVEGFGAIELAAGEATNVCILALDISPTQNVQIQANGNGQIPVDKLCELVKPGAAVVLETLQALQPQ